MKVTGESRTRLGRGPQHLVPKRPRPLRRAFIGVTALGVAMMASVASAQWLASGEGSGTAKSRRVQPLRTVSASAAETLYPGGTGDLVLTIANDNPFDVVVTRVSPNGPANSGVAECDAQNGVAFAQSDGSWPVPKEGQTIITIANSVTMAETSPDACQGQTFTIPVAITGTQRRSMPQLALSPTSQDFGQQHVGTTGAARTFTLTNTGTAAAGPLSAAITGTEATSFVLAGGSCGGGGLAPGGSCTVNVASNPTRRASALVAQLNVTDGAQTLTSTLTVRGVEAVLASHSQSFGDVAVGSARELPVRVANLGDATSGPISFRISTGSTTPAGTYTVVGHTCSTLAPGGECSVTVRFAPPQPGGLFASLVMNATPGTRSSGAFYTMSGNGTSS